MLSLVLLLQRGVDGSTASLNNSFLLNSGIMLFTYTSSSRAFGHGCSVTGDK